jgi:FMN phosphatase YigB (HAD superfamily)
MTALFADVRYVLCDWGGTLCSIDGEQRAWQNGLAALLAAGREHGLALGQEHAGSLVSLFLRTRAQADLDPEHKEVVLKPILARWLAEQGFPDVPDSVLHQLGDAYWAPWVGCLTVIDGADHTLRTLRDRGYRIGLVSNVAAPPLWCRRQLEYLGLWAPLHCVTLSSDLGVRKPHPRVYEHALTNIGDGHPPGPHQVLFVGDSPRFDVAEPARLGMHTVLVRDHANRWPPYQYHDVVPDLTVDRIVELLPHLPGPP